MPGGPNLFEKEGCHCLYSPSCLEGVFPATRLPVLRSSRNRAKALWAAPVEGDVLTGLAVPLPLEAEAIRPVRCGSAPGGYLSRSHFAARGVEQLHPLPLRCRRAGEGLGACQHPVRDLRPPVGQVVCDFELYGDKLDATHLPDQLGKLCLPTPGLPAEDHLQRLALALVGPFVDEQPQRYLGFSGPGVALEGGERDEAQALEPNVAVISLANVVSHHALAPVIGRGLRKLARAGDVTPTDVEPIPRNVPLRN